MFIVEESIVLFVVSTNLAFLRYFLEIAFAYIIRIMNIHISWIVILFDTGIRRMGMPNG